MTILRTTPWYGYVFVIVAFCAGALIIVALFRADLRSERNETALIALCADREALDGEIESTRKILDEHPGARLIFKIPRQLLVDGLRRNEKKRERYEILDCNER